AAIRAILLSGLIGVPLQTAGMALRGGALHRLPGRRLATVKTSQPNTRMTPTAEPATSDFDPFLPSDFRFRSGRSDLGQSCVHLRQLQAPHRRRDRLLTGLSFLNEPLSLTVVTWAIHDSPVVVEALPAQRVR